MATRGTPDYVSKKIDASRNDAALNLLWEDIGKYYREEDWNQLRTTLLRLFHSEYVATLDWEKMNMGFIRLFREHIEPLFLARIYVLMARDKTRERGRTLDGVKVGRAFLNKEMKKLRSEEALVTLKLGLIEVLADGTDRFSQAQLQEAFKSIEELRRSVDALQTSNEKKSVSIHLHKVYSRIAWIAERYEIAYQQLNSLCEVLSEYTSSAPEDDFKKAKQYWVDQLAAFALFAGEVSGNFESVLKRHPAVELRDLLLIFTKCDFVKFCRLKKLINSLPPHLKLIEERKMQLLEDKFRSMAAKKIADDSKMLPADVNSRVDELMRDAETRLEQMEGEIDWEGWTPKTEENWSWIFL